MKKVFLFLFLSVFVHVVMAQDSERMSFRDVPLNEPLVTFVGKMKSLGFVQKSVKDNIVIMEGKFINKMCELYVIATSKSKIVYRVIAFTPKNESWYSLKNEYTTLKEQYSQKYGKPSDEYEFFSKPYYEGDGYELTALRNDKCNYVSFWTLNSGSIVVEIGKFSQLQITYEDKINAEKAKKEKESSVQSDI